MCHQGWITHKKITAPCVAFTHQSTARKAVDMPALTLSSLSFSHFRRHLVRFAAIETSASRMITIMFHMSYKNSATCSQPIKTFHSHLYKNDRWLYCSPTFISLDLLIVLISLLYLQSRVLQQTRLAWKKQIKLSVLI